MITTHERRHILKNVISRCAAILVVIFLLLTSFEVCAAPFKSNLRFGYNSSVYYLTQDGITGNYSGYLYDYLEELSLYLNRHFNYVQSDSSSSYELLQSGDVDVIAITSADPKASNGDLELIDIPIASVPVLLGFRHGSADFYSTRSFKIGYVTETISKKQIVSYLLEKGFRLPTGAEFVPCQNYNELLSLYRDQLIDGMVFSLIERSFPIPIVAELLHAPVYLAVHKGNTVIRDELQSAISKLKMNAPWLDNILYSKHLTSGAPLILSNEELDYLTRHKVINAVAIDNQKPYSYIENGVYKGLIRELIKVFERDLGITFRVTGADSNQGMLSMVRSGQSDVVLDLFSDFNIANANDLYITRPYIDVDYVTVTRDDFLAERDSIVAAPYDFFMVNDFVEKRFPSSQIIYYSSVDDCLRAVSEGKADMVFLKQIAAQAAVNRLGLSNLVVNANVVYTHFVSIGVSNRMDPILVRILDKEITHIDKSNIKRVINKMIYDSRAQQTALSIIHHNPLKAIGAVFFTLTLIIAGLLYLMSERKRSYKAIRHVYYTNSQTGLHNERWFVDNMGKVIGEHRWDRSRGALFVLLVTIRQMEVLQKSYDSRLLDEALRAWVDNMRAQFPWMLECAVSADLSTIDLMCVLPSGKNIATLMDELLKHDSKFVVNGVAVSVHTSCGICFVPKGGAKLSIPNLVVSARMARDEAIEHGTYYSVYDDEIEKLKVTHQRIENLMQKALASGEFEVWMQPKYDLNTRKIIGAEALVRWRSPELGFLMPGAFIDLFEKNAFVIKLDYYMLRKVRLLQQERGDHGQLVVPISVNQSGLHFNEDRYIAHMQSLADEIPVPNGSVELEVTEQAIIDVHSKEQRRKGQWTILMLRRMGYSLSMDDFSKGYSSLSTMMSLPMDTVKIDMAMLNAATESTRSRKILAGVVKMCDGIGMRVICEGIETTDQEKLLLDCGCHYGQGYLFSKPVMLDRFVEMLDRQGAGLDPIPRVNEQPKT